MECVGLVSAAKSMRRLKQDQLKQYSPLLFSGDVISPQREQDWVRSLFGRHDALEWFLKQTNVLMQRNAAPKCKESSSNITATAAKPDHLLRIDTAMTPRAGTMLAACM